ncbi:MAG TPA: hypothetical protein VMW27_27720 [Thermoanaerobaculia bacterium]|nr:hypothetical protein [Thermoanaerobaculia bacterium]
MAYRLAALALWLLMIGGVGGFVWWWNLPSPPPAALEGPAPAEPGTAGLDIPADLASDLVPSSEDPFAARSPDPPPATPLGEPEAAEFGRVWVTPGMDLLAAPRKGAAKVVTLNLYANVAVVDHRPGWVKLRHRGTSGWIAFDDPRFGPDPPLGSAPEPPRPVAARTPEAAHLQRARGLLTPPEATRSLGPYLLYTDFQDADRLGFLDRVAGGVEAVYRARYGRDPVGRPAEAVVLYTREEAFLELLREDTRLAELPASGHSGQGVVALYDGGRPRAEVGATLVHELVHLLNRRALGPVLPSWLDEGLANDLAQSRLGGDGTLDPGTLGGITVRADRQIRRMYGARASLQQLVQAIEEDRLRPLPELLGLDWDEFVRRDGSLHYAHAAFWIRYLLDGEGGALAPGFRAFLDKVADGGSPGGEALRESVGRSWDDLERGFRAWILGQREDAP